MRALQARLKDWILSRTAEIDPSVFATAPGASKEARFRVYERAYWIRMTEAIEEDFERARALVGEEDLRTLVREYAERNPSTSWTLAQAGQGLPDYVRGCHEWNEIPFLARACDWDWMRVEAFAAPSPGGAPAPGTFAIHPSVRTMDLSRADADLVIARFDVEPLVGEPTGERPLLLVWRTGELGRGFALEERVLAGRSADVWRALAKDPDPERLGAVLESLDYDEKAASGLFAALAALGILLPA